MTADTPIQLVCLDLGGVMIRICGGWDEACGLAGVTLSGKAADAAIWPELADVGCAHERGEIDDETFAQRTGQLVAMPAADVLAVSDAWLKGPYVGAVELVAELAAMPRVKTACLSNTNPRHWSHMMRCDSPNHLALERLTWRFTSFELGVMKPSAEIFRHVEAATGIAPESILFFDDSPANIAAARERRWQAQRIDPTGDPIAQIRQHLGSMGILPHDRG